MPGSDGDEVRGLVRDLAARHYANLPAPGADRARKLILAILAGQLATMSDEGVEGLLVALSELAARLDE